MKIALQILSRLHRKSYWEVRYRDGKLVNETECDWSLLPRKGLVEVRLYCPDGKVVALGNPIDASDRLFQFKIAVRYVGRGGETMAHVIGVIDGTDGQCTIFAWEYGQGLVGPLKDNFNQMKYGGPVTANLDANVLGVKPS